MSLCNFPSFNFTIPLPSISLNIPFPDMSFALPAFNLYCPLD